MEKQLCLKNLSAFWYGRRTFGKRYENNSVNGDFLYIESPFSNVPSLVWTQFTYHLDNSRESGLHCQWMHVTRKYIKVAHSQILKSIVLNVGGPKLKHPILHKRALWPSQGQSPTAEKQK